MVAASIVKGDISLWDKFEFDKNGCCISPRVVVRLTPYAFIEQNANQFDPMKMKIYLGLEVPTNRNVNYVVWHEMETFIRALCILKDVQISGDVYEIIYEHERWPEGIRFLKSRDYPGYTQTWGPVDHYKDPKNRLRFDGFSPMAEAENLDALERFHMPELLNNEYLSDLIKDYVKGLEAVYKHLSLAFLYFFKVLERIGKNEFKDSSPSMSTRTLGQLIDSVAKDLKGEEKVRAQRLVKIRHTMSEAHLVTEGQPSIDDVRLCKKIARVWILKVLKEKHNINS